MVKRDIIKIDLDKCDGCGNCVPGCPEGALQIIDNKARLVSDLFCDGLGACIGTCPTGAIEIENREAENYDEKKTMVNIVPQGTNTIKAHLEHLRDHSETDFLNEALDYLKENNIDNPMTEKVIESSCGCMGSKVQDFKKETSGGCPGSSVREFEASEDSDYSSNNTPSQNVKSELQQWPIQLGLLPPIAPFFKDSNLLIAADCVPFSKPDFHQTMLKGKSLAIACPKLDDNEPYVEKLTSIFQQNNIKSVEVAIMEVPCCQGLYEIVKQAISNSGKDIPLTKTIVNIRGF